MQENPNLPQTNKNPITSAAIAELAPATNCEAPPVLELAAVTVGIGTADPEAEASTPRSPPTPVSLGKDAPNFSAAAWKAWKVLAPDVGGLMTPTIPDPQ